MPTPSSNQPPDPPTPSSGASSTCPDDMQGASHSAWRRTRSHDSGDGGIALDHNRDVRDLPVTSGTRGLSAIDPVIVRNHTGSSDDLHLAVDEQTSIESSSRATTMSPAPRASTSAHTSPFPLPIDDEHSSVTKPDGETLICSPSTTSHRNEITLDAIRLRLREANKRAGADCVTASRIEDPLPSLPIGPGYSNTRVS
jgi:hypothetical protein